MTIHTTTRRWLKDVLEKPVEGKAAVATHRALHSNPVHQKYKDDLLSVALSGEVDDLLQGADLWFHCHLHDSFDDQLG